MNKKFFTLLTGAFLMLAMVFSLSAQNSYIDFQTLGLGSPVNKLKSGANDGYFHLKLDYIRTSSTTMMDFTGDDYVLYMGKLATTGANVGKYPVFIDGLSALENGAHDDWFKTFPDIAKAERSAASLWCTVVNDYNQGKNITFDFINKQQRDVPLEVDIFEYEKIGFTSGDPYKVREIGNTWLVSGTISGWEFSRNYATYVDQARPLVSYITTDTVAVLCLTRPAPGPGATPAQGEVFIKIASADDVANGLINSVMYFTLTEALPFTLSAYDFNTMLGTADEDMGQLKFDPNVTPTTGTNAQTNVFTSKLFAEEINPDRLVLLNLEETNSSGSTPGFYYYHQRTFDAAGNLDVGTASITNGGVIPAGAIFPTNYKVVGGAGSDLTALGYIHLKLTKATPTSGYKNNDYLYVDKVYYEDTPSGTRFLTFKNNGKLGDPVYEVTRNALGNVNIPASIAAMGGYVQADLDTAYQFNQSVWRLVYYPSGDSIYINPYQATYLPVQYAELGAMENPDTGKKLEWNEPYAQASNTFTYRAYSYWDGGPVGGYAPLDLRSAGVAPPASAHGFHIDEDNYQFARMVARLQYGRNITSGPRGDATRDGDWYEFTFFHKLYVSMQDLTGGMRVVTLRNGNAANSGINTRIHFDIYSPCNETSSDRTTLDPDLYLIRNERGEYLHVPLFSATDSAVWIDLEKDVHPEFLPSFQWVVQKKYPNSDASPIILINREFDKLVYDDIQLTKKMEKTSFVFRVPRYYKWNNQYVNEKSVTFGTHNTTANKLATFIKLTKEYKNDEKMGYTYIDTTEAKVNLYAFKYLSGIAGIANHWINAPDFKFYEYPYTDTTVYVKAKNNFDKLFFRVDTIDKAWGQYKTYGYNPADYGRNISDLVQLKRQAYRLWVEDPIRMICKNWICLTNGIQSEYALGNIGSYKPFLGYPIFYLRHFYHLEGVKKDVGFALVQTIDKNSYASTYTSERTAFLDFIEEIYGEHLRDIVDGQIKKQQASSLELGFFVASVDDQTAKLKAALRADASNRVSTFQLELDTDPIYRRFNKAVDADVLDDTPKVLKFFSMDRPSYELFENTGLFPDQYNYWKDYGTGIWRTPGMKNYLGVVNINQHPTASTAIYVDTAYVNRGTGPIKPQYMLMVRPQLIEDAIACDEFGRPIIELDGYLRGYYLINATDSAKDKTGAIVDLDYIWDTKWERLVFTDAIHARDYLYILNGFSPDSAKYQLKLPDGTYQLSLDLLDKAAAEKDTKIIKVYLGDNYHKDVVFSMRFIERGTNDFVIESETGWGNKNNADRIFHFTPTAKFEYRNSTGPMIAPCAGGWIKIQNNVPVISRSDEVYNMPNGYRMNTRRTEDLPIANDNVGGVTATVIGNDGFVTILNAAGKKVAISNILGQTVATTVLSSDNATIAAPKGVVVVAIEGEAAVKALVK